MSSILNISKVLVDNLHMAKKWKLILDLNQEVTTDVTCWWIKSIDLDCNRYKIIHDLLKNISDTIFLIIRLDRWIKDYIAVSKVNLDVKHWR